MHRTSQVVMWTIGAGVLAVGIYALIMLAR
jgi:hypothetical protein